MRESKMNRKAAGAYSFVLVAATALLSSCSSLPTSPVGGATSDLQGTSNVETIVWNTVASVWVNKGEAKTVSGSRYTLSTVRGGLGAGTQVTISERDPQVLDVVLGPESTVMLKAGSLTINYGGTSAALLGSTGRLYRHNPSTGGWELVTGTNDLARQKFTAKITKFGRYAYGGDPGKAGW